MLDRGKLAVLTMFAVAIAAASFAWWWNYSRGQRCLAFYGAEAAYMVRTAKNVELLELAPTEESTANSTAETLSIGGQTYAAVRSTDISQAKGLIHARTSIVDDSSFRWDDQPGDCQPKIWFAVRFSDHSMATLAFDFGCQRLLYVEKGRTAMLIPKVAQGWESFLSRQIREPHTKGTDY